MNMNDERRNTIDLLLSHYTEDEEAEREQARAEYENMTDEELMYELGTFQHEAEKEWQAEKMEILEERGE
ncbi:hypothetical protein D7V91_05700 [bacterium 1xD42-67]|nr:hypothetical protein D7V91_05700 [bacterium 1xD42-67]